MERYELESAEKWNNIIRQIPALNFSENWLVKVIPPFGGAVARFQVRHKDNEKAYVSVYCDWYERLGYFGAPHWEIYPNIEDMNERFALNDTEELMKAIHASIDKQMHPTPNRFFALHYLLSFIIVGVVFLHVVAG